MSREITNTETPEKPTVRAPSVAQEFKQKIAPTVSIPGLELMKGVLSHVAAGRNKDHIVVVVDSRRAYFYAEPLPKTFVEMPDYQDLDTRRKCCGRLRRCLYGTRQAAVGMVMGKMSKRSFNSPCRKLVGVVHGDDILLAGPRSLVDAVRKSLQKRYEMVGARPTDASDIVLLNRRSNGRKELESRLTLDM